MHSFIIHVFIVFSFELTAKHSEDLATNFVCVIVTHFLCVQLFPFLSSLFYLFCETATTTLSTHELKMLCTSYCMQHIFGEDIAKFTSTLMSINNSNINIPRVKSTLRLWMYKYTLTPCLIVNEYQLLCDAHTVPEQHRGNAALFIFYSLLYFSAFSFCFFVILTVSISFLGCSIVC